MAKKLWYTEPASEYMCGLPIGTGRLVAGRYNEIWLCERDETTAEAVVGDLDLVFDADVAIKPLITNDVTSAVARATPSAPVLFTPRTWAALTAAERSHEHVLELRYVIAEDDLAELGKTLRWRPAVAVK